MNRFEWLKAVLQSDLLDRAKVMASALAVQFGNDETGQINPALPTLCSYLKMTEQTARRALADLSEAGWLARTVGLGRGNRSAYVLLSPGNIVPLRPAISTRKPAEKGARAMAKRSHGCEVSRAGKGITGASKRYHKCNPPIKDEQSFEQIGGARPAAHLVARVAPNSDHAAAWDRWLAENGYPPLANLTALHRDGAFWPTSRFPPSDPEQIDWTITKRVMDWAVERGARDDRAA